MQTIKPFVDKEDMLCAEVAAGANAMVVFGASGDLVRRKLISSLFGLYNHSLISEQFYLIGAGRKNLSDRQFRQNAQELIQRDYSGISTEQIQPFIDRLYYISGDYDRALFYRDIESRLNELDGRYDIGNSHIFYLAVPPVLYGTIVEQLGSAGLSKQHSKLVVEKPFGRDLQSAGELNDKIRTYFDESQVYRIDHYLGKETVQNILMFRFANSIFEPVWNRNYIDHVQITIAESIGVEHRGGYYDKAGALRDMFQNHMLQMLALAAMEPPTSFQADHIRDERVKLLRSIRPFESAAPDKFIVRGQYDSGSVGGKKVIGYRTEPGIEPDSRTETFVAAKIFIDNWRWKDVPFYLRAGKRLSGKDTEIAITFKKVPHSMFAPAGLADTPPNVLVLQIQPDEGISLSFQAKRPGSKLCMSTLRMNFSYREVFGTEAPEAYRRLLLDCMLGDQTLFNRYDSVEVSWRLLAPVLKAWETDDSTLFEYPAGSESFPQADSLIEADGRKWRKLSEI
jgi:glucose-6-phosphate 1-dehydrogenase